MRHEARRKNFLVSGRRWRKTSLCARLAVEAALNGKRVGWFAPTHKQGTEGWNEAKNACAVLVAHKIVQFHETDRIAHFPNGGKIEFRSLEDPDNARGITADLIILEEAGEIVEDAYRTVLRPVISDTLGDLWAIGTPKGLTWFQEEWDKANTAYMNAMREGRPYDGSSMSWQAPTLGFEMIDDPDRPGMHTIRRLPHRYENPCFPWSEMLEMWDDMPERSFLQEIGAQFLQSAGGVFTNVKECHTLTMGDRPRVGAHSYQIGVDIARKNDYTVISVLDTTTFEQVYWRRFNRTGFTDIAQKVIDVYKLYKGKVVVDGTGVGDAVYDMLHQKGVSVEAFHFTNTSKRQLIDSLASHIEKKRIRLQQIDTQRTELNAYQYKTSDFNNLLMSAPSGKHDDTVIALALSCLGKKPTVQGYSVNDMRVVTGQASQFAGIEIGVGW